MKTDIHPTYFIETQVMCSCGNKFVTGSTKQEIHVEVCHKCHPLYTGEKRFIDSLGQVERFQKKQADAKVYQEKHPKKAKMGDKDRSKPKSLRELLMES